MTSLHFFYLLIIVVSIAIGAFLSQALLRRPSTARFTSAFAAGVLLAICLLYLLPESFHFFSKAASVEGPLGNPHSRDALWIGVGLSLGFLSILSIERYFLQVSHHAHCSGHSHQHPHESIHKTHEHGTVGSLALALCLHSLFDGVVLRSGEELKSIGIPLVLGLMLHKIPETASLMAVLRKGQVRSRTQALVLGMFAISMPLGLLAAHHLQRILSLKGAGFFMAFATGSLLHLVIGHLLPESTEPDSKTSKAGVFGTMLFGFLIMFCARMLGSE